MGIIRLLILAGISLLGACGGGDSESSKKPVECTGTTCACPAGQSCTFSQTGCGAGSCTLECLDHNQCSGSCGESCSLSCAGGSTCSASVGKSGSVNCADGSTCHVKCEADCSVTCGAGSTCTLQCAGDTAPKEIPQGGGC